MFKGSDIKKKINRGVLLAAVLLLLPIQGTRADSAAVQVLALRLGGQEVLMDGARIPLEAAPFIQGGRVMVPLRFIGEALHADVAWNASQRAATLQKGSLTLTVPVGGTPSVNGRLVATDQAAVLRGGRVFVPIRLVSEQLGAFVQYDAASGTILVRPKTAVGWLRYVAPSNIMYHHPGEVTAGSDPARPSVAVFRSSSGSELRAFYLDKTPSGLQSQIRSAYTKQGWKLLTVFRNAQDTTDKGYEMRFSKTGSDGIRRWLCVYVETLGKGAHVGELRCEESRVLTDGFLLYQVFSR